jgi:hypothetical protein
MGNGIRENRRRLVELIVEMKSFEESDLAERLIREKGTLAVDTQQTLREFLADLRELGVVRYRNGVYFAV